MKNRDLVRLEDGRGTMVHVREGAVWITQHGDARDYYVPAPASFTVTRDGLTLISAVGHASFELGSARFAPQARATTAGL